MDDNGVYQALRPRSLSIHIVQQPDTAGHFRHLQQQPVLRNRQRTGAILSGHLRPTQSASRCSLWLDIPQEFAPSCAEMFHSWRRERTNLQIGGVDGAGNRDNERAHLSFTEECRVLSKVIDEHNVAVYIAFL